MKKVLLLVITAMLAVSSSLSLEPMNVGFVYTAGTPTSVRVQLADNTINNIFVGESFTTGITPNNSGVIVVNVKDFIGTNWADFQASDVSTYNTLDIYVNGTLYNQYRLDVLILNSAQTSVFDNDGNFNPPRTTSTLGTDDNRWQDAFIAGSTIHIGPPLGMGAGNELAFSYDDGTNTATMTVDNEGVMNATKDLVTINKIIKQDIGGKNVAIGDNVFNTASAGTTNVAIGYQTLMSNTSGSNNIALGELSSSKITTGNTNISIGYGAFQNSEDGIANVAIGQNSLYNMLAGQSNVAIGNYSGYTSTSGNNNLFLGNSAGSNASQKVNAENSMAIGNGAYTTADNQMVLGSSSITETNIAGDVTIAGGLVANPTGADKDFIFGHDDTDWTTGIESKMFFDQSKGAFRAGRVLSPVWNNVNVGNNSTAFGFNTKANNEASTAMGQSTEASGEASTAMGSNTTASGDYSTTMGFGSTASNDHSTAMGLFSNAEGDASTAMGGNATASSNYSTAMGRHTIANEVSSTAMGEYNDHTVTGELLTIGNGTGTSARSNAFEVYKNGDVIVPALGNTTSTQNLQVDADGKLVTGTSILSYIEHDYAGGITPKADLANDARVINLINASAVVNNETLGSLPNGSVVTVRNNSGFDFCFSDVAVNCILGNGDTKTWYRIENIWVPSL